MSTILDLTAERIASAWVSDVPVGEYIAPFVASGVGALLKKLHAGTASNSERDQDRWARLLFATPKRLKTKEQAADHIAKLVLNWLPHEIRTGGAAIAKVKDAPTAARDKSAAPRTGTADLQTILAGLQTRPHFQDIKKLFEDLKKFRVGVNWTPKEVERLLREMRRKLINADPRIDRLIDDIQEELIMMPIRYALAKALATAYSRLPLPFTMSDQIIGQEVHKKLQTKYVTLFNKTYGYKVVSESDTLKWPLRMVYRFGQPDTELKYAVREESPFDNTLLALLLARLSPFSDTGELRDDLVDLTSAENWEIKPIGSAPTGVAQETFYRMTYNFWATVFSVTGIPVNVKFLAAGSDWQNYAQLLLHPIYGTGWIAKPFCLDALPGLVLYFVVRGLTPEELAVFEAIVMAILLTYLKKLSEKLRELREAVAKALEELEKFTRALLQLLQVIATMLALLAAAALIFFILPRVPLQVIILGGVIIFLLSDDDVQLESATEAKREESVTLNLGHCTLVNFPIGQFPKLLETTSRLYQQGLKATAEELSKFNFPEPSEQTVPVMPSV